MTMDSSAAASAEQSDARPGGPWTLKDLAWASVAAVMFTGMGIVMALLFTVLLAVLAEPDGQPNPTAYIFVALAAEAWLLLPSWVWGPAKYGGGWKALGRRRFKLAPGLALMALAVVVTILVNMGWGWVRQRFGWSGQPDILPLFGEGVSGLLTAILLGGVLAPIAEEVFFRGFMYAGMRTRWGVGWALAASSLVFAVAHLSLATLPQLLIMGFVLAYLYERTDSIWPSIILHMANNSVAFIALYLAR